MLIMSSGQLWLVLADLAVLRAYWWTVRGVSFKPIHPLSGSMRVYILPRTRAVEKAIWRPTSAGYELNANPLKPFEGLGGCWLP